MKPSASVEALATVCATDDDKVIASTCQHFLGFSVRQKAAVDSKDLLSFLFTSHAPKEKFIPAQV